MSTLRILRRRKYITELIARACVLCAAALAFLIFRHFTGITCPIRHITGISCPTCGMTGAILSLSEGDIAGYLSQNAFALPVGALLLSLLFPSLWKQKSFLIAVAVTLAANAAYYACRLFGVAA